MIIEKYNKKKNVKYNIKYEKSRERQGEIWSEKGVGYFLAFDLPFLWKGKSWGVCPLCRKAVEKLEIHETAMPENVGNQIRCEREGILP